ncbi:unnamed protein product [Meloidogyne enterolobii]|uniref:Uncharacterized protein n=1 Tax=Meloidogyne enterolobii TaxID=390850 RepID=A0ACB0YPS1_MELEN
MVSFQVVTERICGSCSSQFYLITIITFCLSAFINVVFKCVIWFVFAFRGHLVIYKINEN